MALRSTASNPGFLRRVAARIYPAQDELAVYTMAVSIGVLALADREFAALLVNGVYLILIEGPREAFLTSKWDGVTLIVGGTLLITCSIASFVASLVLPFTRRRLDTFLQLILLAHMIIVGISHFVIAQDSGNPFNALIALAFMFWVFGYCCCIRFRLVQEFVTDRQSSSREAAFAGFLAAASILICTVILQWHWASCYAFAAVNAVVATRLVTRLA